MSALLWWSIAAFIAQFLGALICVIGFSGDYRKGIRDGDEKFAQAATKWTRISVLFFATSPLAILTVPALILFFFFKIIKDGVQYVVPAFKGQS